MKIRFTPRARDDLVEIADFLRERSACRDSGPHCDLESLQIIARYPLAGRRQTTARIRKLVVRRYPYLVYYTLRDLENNRAERQARCASARA